MNQKTLSASGRWYRNRDDWVRYVLAYQGITADQKNVALFIAMNMNPADNHTKHQQVTISTILGVKVITVKRAVKKLIAENLIEKEQVERGKRSRAVNHYKLVFLWDV